MPNKQSLTKQSFFLVAGRGAAYLVSILLPLILVRIFSKAEYGLYTQIFLIFNTLFLLGQMGVAQGIYYFLPRHPEKKNALMMQTFIFVIITGSLALCILLIFKSSIAAAFHNEEMIKYITLLGLYSFFMIGSSFLEISMIAEGEAKLAAFTFALSQIGNSFILILAAVFTESIFCLMCGAVFFSICRFIVQSLYMKKKYSISLKQFDFKFLKNQLAYSAPIGFANIALVLQNTIHKYFISFFFDPVMFAVYSIGCFRIQFLFIISTSVNNVMIPAFSLHQKKGDNSSILRIWNNAIRKTNIFLLPAFSFFFIMANDFIVVMFTVNYSDSIPIFRISLLTILLVAINPGPVLRAYAETKYIMKIGFLRVPGAIAALYLFVSLWGVLGAIIANFVTMLIFRSLLMVKASRVLDISLQKMIQWNKNITILLISISSGLPLILIKTYLDLEPVISLGGSFILYSLLYFTLSIYFETIEKNERLALQNYISDKLSLGLGKK